MATRVLASGVSQPATMWANWERGGLAPQSLGIASRTGWPALISATARARGRAGVSRVTQIGHVEAVRGHEGDVAGRILQAEIALAVDGVVEGVAGERLAEQRLGHSGERGGHTVLVAVLRRAAVGADLGALIFEENVDLHVGCPSFIQLR